MQFIFDPTSMKCGFIRPDDVEAGTFVLNGDGVHVVVTAGLPPNVHLLRLTDHEGSVAAELLNFRVQIDGIAFKPEGLRVLLSHPIERIDRPETGMNPPSGVLFFDENGPSILCHQNHYRVLVNLATWHATDFVVHDTTHGVGKWSLTANGVDQDRQELFKL